MDLIRSCLGGSSVKAVLPNCGTESHSVWFSGIHGNTWSYEYIFGVESNYDLGLASKVNMVLHGDGSMNIWLKSALLPFDEYWVQGRNNVLGIAKPTISHSYSAKTNEQFDLVLSNPPFSIKLTPDEKKKIANAFEVMLQPRVRRYLLSDGTNFFATRAILLHPPESNMNILLMFKWPFSDSDFASKQSVAPYDSFVHSRARKRVSFVLLNAPPMKSFLSATA